MFTQKNKCLKLQRLCTETQISGGPCPTSPLPPFPLALGLAHACRFQLETNNFWQFSFLKQLLTVSEVSGQEEGKARVAVRGNILFYELDTLNPHPGYFC